MDDPQSVVLASVEAFNRHDTAACLACFAPEATWRVAGVERAIPLAEVELIMVQFFASDARATIRSMVASGNLVIAEYEETFVDERSQARMMRPLVLVYEVAAGKIQAVREYSHPDWIRPAPAGERAG